nr:hypothetical protein [uncultured archaeon]
MKYTIPQEFMGVTAEEALKLAEGRNNKPAPKPVKGKPNNKLPCFN